MGKDTAKINAQIDSWLTRLIDLSRRNRLLYFRESRRASLRVTDPGPAEIFEWACDPGSAYRFWVHPPDQADAAEDDESEGDGPASVADARRLGLVCAAERPRAGLATAEPKWQELNKTLSSLSARARLDLEERGVRILYLAFGLLRWQDPETKEIVRSPILMVPMELARESRTEPWELTPCDEDTVLNPVLAVKLQRDYKMVLPEVPDDWDNSDLSSYLDQIRAVVMGVGWQVDEELWLGLFSFHKLPMYRDLDNHRESLCEHRLIAGLSGAQKAEDLGLQTLVTSDGLDETLSPRESHLVVDADSSQLAAIETVKKGTDLVLHGPPGTGKSQTITNVVAEMLAAGKTVLFVSEKMAALEVVFDRLKQARLDHLCLELHSHKASKREVVRELYATMRGAVEHSRGISDAELERLARRREQLNGYVDSLHKVRKPLGRTAFGVLAELAQYISTAEYPIDQPWAASMSREGNDWLLDNVGRLSSVWGVMAEREGFAWHGIRREAITQHPRRYLGPDVRRANDAVEELRRDADDLVMSLGLEPTASIVDGEAMGLLAGLLTCLPTARPDWLRLPPGHPLPGTVDRAEEQHSRRRQLCTALYDRQGTAFVDRADEGHLDDLAQLVKVLDERLSGGVRSEDRLARLVAVCHWLCSLRDTIPRVAEGASKLGELLGLSSGGSTVRNARRLQLVTELCIEEPRPLPSWITLEGSAEAESVFPEMARKAQEAERGFADLATVFNDSVFELDLQVLNSRYQTEHRKPLACLRSQYRHDRRAVQEHARRRLSSREIPPLVAQAATTHGLWSDVDSVGRQLLGRYYRGRQTDYELAGKALERGAKAARHLNRPGDLPEGIASLVADEAASGLEAAERAGEIRKLMEVLIVEANDAGLPPLDQLVLDGKDRLVDVDLALLRKWLDEVCLRLAPLQDSLGELFRLGAAMALVTLDEFRQDVEHAVEIRQLTASLAQADAELSEWCGSLYLGEGTDWEQLRTGTRWAAAVVQVLRGVGRDVPDAFVAEVAAATEGRLVSPETHDAILAKLESTRAALATIEGWFEPHPFEIDGGPAAEAAWDSLTARLSDMYGRLDDLTEVADAYRIKDTLVEAGLVRLADALWESPPSVPDLLPCTRAAASRGWLQSIYTTDEILRDFRTEDHERTLKEFRTLDRQHWRLGTARVLKKVGQEQQASGYVPQGGERRVLLREAQKQRRHFPIRRLFEKIPHLLLELKPCLLMSPLSVSQFLPPDMQFDLVVFDEASQICSEDAAGAIYRGRQLLVCGDQKQLPPTDFFRKNIDDDDGDYDEEEDAVGVFESVLDDCLAAGTRDSWLRWHYRSKHEHLIAFSNDRFYENRLVTFPAAVDGGEWLGVHLDYLADGVYDRGGRRTNRVEASRVADVVVDHLREHPGKSLGVVSFSLAQTQAIKDELDARAAASPEIDGLVRAGEQNGYFVKNLENVQGDTRDVMLFSIGYGRDANGRLSMNFGPLNREGGERRLNVAITRARERVLIVSSIRASDIDVSQTPAAGVRHLRDYLDFAQRGPDALAEALDDRGGEPDSPLEVSVAAAIREMGYHVVHQVGCSGFRIDLGVRSASQPGRFILGVECDGATYHSSPTARDRDRLRQEVLESMGWRIHRIWSPSWVDRRPAELKRLREALEAAAKAAKSLADVPPDRPADRDGKSGVKVVRVDPLPFAGDDCQVPPWTAPYHTCHLSAPKPWGYEFHEPGSVPSHAEGLAQLVAAEGPLHVEIASHRLKDHWGLQRLGPRMQATVNQALRAAEKAGALVRRGDFLWPPDPAFKLSVRIPVPADPLTFRKLEHIPPEEIELAMVRLVHDGSGVEHDALLSETARVFGVKSLGSSVRRTLTAVLEDAVKRGALRRTNGTVVA